MKAKAQRISDMLARSGGMTERGFEGLLNEAEIQWSRWYKSVPRRGVIIVVCKRLPDREQRALMTEHTSAAMVIEYLLHDLVITWNGVVPP